MAEEGQAICRKEGVLCVRFASCVARVLCRQALLARPVRALLPLDRSEKREMDDGKGAGRMETGWRRVEGGSRRWFVYGADASRNTEMQAGCRNGSRAGGHWAVCKGDPIPAN